MVSNGVGGLAGYFGVLHIKLPDYAMAIVGGVIIGLVAPRRWLPLSIAFSASMVAAPKLLLAIYELSSSSLNAWARIIVLIYTLAVIPFTLAASYLVSRRRRLRDRRKSLNLCVGCGYDLTGKESAVCPECGQGFDLE